MAQVKGMVELLLLLLLLPLSPPVLLLLPPEDELWLKDMSSVHRGARGTQDRGVLLSGPTMAAPA